MDLTSEQRAVVATAPGLKAGECLRVIAFAGAGKTSTLRAVAQAMGQRRGLYVAFNKSIAQEAKTKFPANIECRTMHSIAWKALTLDGTEVGQVNAHSILTMFREGDWSKEAIPGLRPISQARHVARLVAAFCQGAADSPTDGEIAELLDRHVYRAPAGGADAVPATHRLMWRKREAIRKVLETVGREACRRLLDWRSEGLKVSHDVYLKRFALDADLVRHALRWFHYVCLDEAQDLNPVMRQIAVASGKPVIAVGDPWQSIYSWRGAQDALRHLPGRRLYLSQSFRFGEEIAKVARAVLNSRPGPKPEKPLRGVPRSGEVVVYTDSAREDVRAVLCRTNAGLLAEAFELAKEGRSFFVPGGMEEMMDEVRSAQALYENRIRDVKADRLKRFEDWAQLIDEVEETEDASLSRLVEAVMDGLVERLPMVERACAPTEDSADLVLTTVHKAKGREWDVVALADDFPDFRFLQRRFGEAADAGDAWTKTSLLEEWNIAYVAVTRAIRQLRLPQDLYERFAC